MTSPTPAHSEEVLWEGGPSCWTGAGGFALAALLAVAGAVVGALWLIWALFALPLALFIAGARYFKITSTRYRLTTERLVSVTGILTRTTDEVELYRVKDSRLVQPLSLRMMGLGHIVLTTSDASTPTVTLQAIPGAEKVRDLIRNQVEKIRERKGVREVDVE